MKNLYNMKLYNHYKFGYHSLHAFVDDIQVQSLNKEVDTEKISMAPVQG